jgi:multiple sugar transport system permease protein/putative aldouronate transport system permease protein
MPSIQSKSLYETGGNFIGLILLSLFAFLCVYPFYYILINSLSGVRAIAKGVFFLPQDFTLEAYLNLKSIPGLGSAAVVSTMRTIVGSLLSTFCCSFPAFLITRRNVPIRKIIYRFFIFTMYVGAGFIPSYLVNTRLGLRNNFLVYILPGAVGAYSIILVKTYIESMPSSLWESAEIDGAGIMRIYWQLIVPLAKPILACLIIFAAVGQWNSWADDLFYMAGSKGRNLHVLQFLLYQNMQSNMAAAIRNVGTAGAAAAMEVPPMTLRMAMTFVTVLPILCVYPVMQRHFVKGIMLGAIKG